MSLGFEITNMRLSDQEKSACMLALNEVFGKDAKIWLFGSRVDDSKHGGDVDLYIETFADINVAVAKIEFRKLIWPTFGDQKIDIIVRCKGQPLTAFQEMAKQTGVLLNNSMPRQV